MARRVASVWLSWNDGLTVATDKISTSKPPVAAAALVLGLTTSSIWNFLACRPVY